MPERSSSARFLLRALAYRNFRLFFGGQVVSLVGTWITTTATNWLVYRLTGSPFLLGVVGFAGNWLAARIRSSAGRRLDSPALVADGDHARADAYVSLAVIASAAAVWVGVRAADPLIGLAITLVILRITWHSWSTVRSHQRPSTT